MADILRNFVIFAPLGLLLAVALFSLALAQRLSEVRVLFLWVEKEGHHRGTYDFAKAIWTRARLCRAGLGALGVAGALFSFAAIAASVAAAVPTLGEAPTFVLLVSGLVCMAFAMGVMILDGRVELAMMRARFEDLTGRDTSQLSVWR